MAMSTSTLPIVSVTEAARKIVLDMRAAEPDGDSLALCIEVTGMGEGGREYAYDLLFEPLADMGDDDEVRESAGLPVLVHAPDVDKLQGATLDHTEVAGLVIRNPNRPAPAASAPEMVVLEGSVEERILALLDGEINPMLASHGGFARLERVEGDVAYVTMGGGCQGCGLATLTLREGISSQIIERIPEIREVLDDTDHASGANPFFQ